MDKTVKNALKLIPNDVLFNEAKQRKDKLRQKLGPWHALRITRKCLGCGKLFSARDMRTHTCNIAWYKRTPEALASFEKRKPGIYAKRKISKSKENNG